MIKQLNKPVDEVSYAVYCACLDEVFYPGSVQQSSLGGLTAPVIKFLASIKDQITSITEEFKLSLLDIYKAFRNRDFFALFKALKFSLVNLGKALHAAGKALSGGLLKVFKEIAKTDAIQQLRKGLISVDDFLNRWPLLKKLSGIAVAGILIYIWLNMAFLGDFEFDLDLGDIVNALSGSFSLAELFASPSGLLMLALLGTGFVGISFPWLGRNSYNIVMALIYTLVHRTSPTKASGLKKLLKFGRT